MHGQNHFKSFVTLPPTYFALHMAIPKEVHPDADVIWRIQVFNKSSHQWKEATIAPNLRKRLVILHDAQTRAKIILKTSATMI